MGARDRLSTRRQGSRAAGGTRHEAHFRQCKRPLAEAIARRISVYRGEKITVANARVERFNDREIYVEIYDNVRGEDVFILQPTSNPANDNLMELLIITDALRRASARRITAVSLISAMRARTGNRPPARRSQPSWWQT